MTLRCRSITPSRAVPHPATFALRNRVRLICTSRRPRIGALTVTGIRVTGIRTTICADPGRPSPTPVGSHRATRCLSNSSAKNFRLRKRSASGIDDQLQKMVPLKRLVQGQQQPPQLQKTVPLERPVQAQQQPARREPREHETPIKLRPDDEAIMKQRLYDEATKQRVLALLEEKDDSVTAKRWNEMMEESANNWRMLKKLQDEKAASERKHQGNIKRLTERLQQLENQPDRISRLQTDNESLRTELRDAQTKARSLENSYSKKYEEQKAKDNELLEARNCALQELRSTIEDMQLYVSETEPIREKHREEQQALRDKQARAAERLTYERLKVLFDNVNKSGMGVRYSLLPIRSAYEECQKYWVRARDSFELVQQSLLEHTHHGNPSLLPTESAHALLVSSEKISAMLTTKVTTSTESATAYKYRFEEFQKHLELYQRHAHILRRDFYVRYRGRGSLMTSTKLAYLVAKNLEYTDRYNLAGIAEFHPQIMAAARSGFASLGKTIQSVTGFLPKSPVDRYVGRSHLAAALGVRKDLLVWSFASFAPPAEQVAFYYRYKLAPSTSSVLALLDVQQLESLDRPLHEEFLNKYGAHEVRRLSTSDNAMDVYENAVLMRCRAQEAAGTFDMNELANARAAIAEELRAATMSACRLEATSAQRAITDGQEDSSHETTTSSGFQIRYGSRHLRKRQDSPGKSNDDEKPGPSRESVGSTGVTTLSHKVMDVSGSAKGKQSDFVRSRPPAEKLTFPERRVGSPRQLSVPGEMPKQDASKPSEATTGVETPKATPEQEPGPIASKTSDAATGGTAYKGRAARKRSVRPRPPAPVRVNPPRMFTATKPQNMCIRPEESVPVLDYQLSAEVLDSGATSETTPWSHKLYRSSNGQQVEVEYCMNRDWAQQVAEKFLVEPVVGFDIEWEPHRPKTRFNDVRDARINVSVIQLAAEDKIALFHVAQFPGLTAEDLIPPALQEILTSSSIVKTGVNIAGDATRIKTWFGIECKGLFELSHLYRLVTYSKDQPELVSRRQVALDNQVEDVLGYPLLKGPVRISSWSARLTREQRDYAAADAYAGFRLYHALDAARLCMDPPPPRPALHELNQPILLADGKPPPKPSKAASSVATAPDREDPLSTEGNPSDVNEAEEDTVSQEPQQQQPPDPRLEAADRWSDQHRARHDAAAAAAGGGARKRAPPPRKACLRAYHLWHEAGLAPSDVARLLRTPPLQLSTVRSYIAEAVAGDRSLGYDAGRLREVVTALPPYVTMRYKGLLSRVGG